MIANYKHDDYYSFEQNWNQRRYSNALNEITKPIRKSKSLEILKDESIEDEKDQVYDAYYDRYTDFSTSQISLTQY